MCTYVHMSMDLCFSVYAYLHIHMYMCTNVCFYAQVSACAFVHVHMCIHMLTPPQRSTKINAIRDILGYFHPHSSDHDDSDRWWTCEDMYISWFHSDVSDGSVKQ